MAQVKAHMRKGRQVKAHTRSTGSRPGVRSAVRGFGAKPKSKNLGPTVKTLKIANRAEKAIRDDGTDTDYEFAFRSTRGNKLARRKVFGKGKVTRRKLYI